MVDGRVVRGDRTRRAVLDAAVARASVEGLEGMTLGKLAAELGVSKSGLFSHWPDKEALQLAVVAHAGELWTEGIIRPALRRATPLERLWMLHIARLRFYRNDVLPGGCFFAAVQTEFDDRPGRVHDAIANAFEDWFGLLEGLARRAKEDGQLVPEADPTQLAFELDALGVAVVTRRRLLDRAPALTLARRGALARLRAVATDPDVLPRR